MEAIHEHYLDNAATTMVCAEAAAAAADAMLRCYGNPSSTHTKGREAKKLLDKCRKQVADALGCAPAEVYFTSCGSESDNWALKGTMRANEKKGRHLIISAIEHHAILHTLEHLEKAQGFSVTYLPVDSLGRVDPQAAKAAIQAS